MNEQQPKRRSVTESPWYWVYLFSTAGLIMLVLMGPKFGPRQAQIERKYQGREIAMTAEEARQADAELSSSESTLITLAPFYVVLGAVFVVAWIMLWRGHFRRRKHDTALHEAAS